MPAAGPERIQVYEPDLGPLLARARRLIAAGGRRLLGLTGAPGAGKSTVAAAMVGQLTPAAVLVPMDGFHLAGAELHRLGRQDRKGASDTFDAPGFVALLHRLRDPAGENIWAPRFDRRLEEPIAGAISVDPAVPLVVIEGNYLLVETGAWARVRGLLDEVWYLEPDESTRVARLIDRHLRYGRSRPEAADRATRGSDYRNAQLIAATRHRADLIVELTSHRGGAGRRSSAESGLIGEPDATLSGEVWSPGKCGDL